MFDFHEVRSLVNGENHTIDGIDYYVVHAWEEKSAKKRRRKGHHDQNRKKEIETASAVGRFGFILVSLRYFPFICVLLL